jgi:NhaP-type Na+/H+ or K+/H+ antiporter
LPVIIFAAGYKLGKKHFFSNIFYISYLGIFSSVIIFVTLSCLICLISEVSVLFNNQQLSLQEILILSCILCSNDTVSAVSLIKEQSYPKLNSILFGEGIVNDAVVIVMFRIIQN